MVIERTKIVLNGLIFVPVYWYIYKYSSHPLAKYPGPFVASFTNFWRLWRFLDGDNHTADQKLHKCYGPIIRVGPNSLLFESLSVFHAIYGSTYGSKEYFDKGSFYNMAVDPESKGVNLFSARNQLEHQERRENVESAALASGHIIQYRSTVSGNIEALLESFRFLYHINPETAIDIAPGIHEFAFNTLFEIIYGKSKNFQLDASHRYRDALVVQRKFTNTVFSIPFVPWLKNARPSNSVKRLWAAYDDEGLPTILTAKRPNPKIPVHKRRVSRLSNFLTSFSVGIRMILWLIGIFISNLAIGLQGALYNDDELPDSLKMGSELVDASKPSESSKPYTPPTFNIRQNIENMLSTKGRRDKRKHLNPNTVLGECSSFLSLGVGSTSAALTAVLYYLGIYPEYQTSILDEHAESTSSAKDFCLYPNNVDRDSTLRSVIKESLRLSPPFPTCFPRFVVDSGYTAVHGLPPSLPVGTMVGANIYVLSRSKDVWGKDADVWRPERWLDKKFTSSLKQSLKPLQGQSALEEAFVVFGTGSRGCAGKDIAWMVLVEAVVAILSEWEVITTPGSLKGQNAMEMQYDELKIELKPRSGVALPPESITAEVRLAPAGESETVDVGPPEEPTPDADAADSVNLKSVKKNRKYKRRVK